MRTIQLALLTSLLLGITTTAWADAPAAPPQPAVTAPAASPAAATLPAGNLAPAPQSALPFNCPTEPITTCTSCLYFGIQTSYQCTIFCVNGVPHRSCTTCGDGCPQ